MVRNNTLELKKWRLQKGNRNWCFYLVTFLSKFPIQVELLRSKLTLPTTISTMRLLLIYWKLKISNNSSLFQQFSYSNLNSTYLLIVTAPLALHICQDKVFCIEINNSSELQLLNFSKPQISLKYITTMKMGTRGLEILSRLLRN